MFDWLKARAVVAEVDGIKFYRDESLRKYLEDRKRERDREGKMLYTFEIPWFLWDTVCKAKVALEERGCFDYEVKDCGGVVVLQYWAPKILIKWKD